MISRCTLCGKYPFCNFITTSKVIGSKNCNLFIKRSLESNVEINKGCQFQPRKTNSKKFKWKKNK